MSRRSSLLTASLVILLTVWTVPPAIALDEAERLWLVGEHASADGLDAIADRTLERFVDRYASDPRMPQALVMLGKARLRLGKLEPALDAIHRAQQLMLTPAQVVEAKFWEAEALFRLKKYPDARTAYDEVRRSDPSGPFGPDALYGYGWSELELKRAEPAIAAFRDFLQTWPDHTLAPSVTYQLARALVTLKRYREAVPLLTGFATKYPGHKLAPDAQYLLGWARVTGGDTKAGFADLRTFVEMYPNHDLAPEARKLLSQTAVRTGDKSQLVEMYENLMTQTPTTPQALVEAMGIATRLNRPRDHDAAWRKLRTDFPKDPLTHRTALDLATAAFKRKEWNDASEIAQVAAKSEEDAVKSEAWLLTGESELKLKRYPPAIKAFQTVDGMAKIDPAVRYRALAGLGLAHEEQKEFRAALAAYESVASKSTDSALRDWARERAAAVKARLGKPSEPAAKRKSKS